VAGLRTLIQLRRTGKVSVPRFRDRPGSPQWWARLLSAPGFACAVGASWRPDVDPDTRTALVTSGPFRLVRNPIFTATVATATGLTLLVPNLLAAAMLVGFLTALQVQVRLVEEPYLHRVHGAVYDQYAARTGRFLPWIGRQRTGTGPA
jgi:protein-S-isoprenylcysteine O-methyltransferase Ste14